MKTKRAYVDMTDFNHHLGIGYDSAPTPLFENVKSCKKHRPCTAECGIGLVEIKFIKLVRKGRRLKTKFQRKEQA